jgi:hypothetical protein
MSGMGVQASASSVPGPNFSTPRGIDAYLQSRGINPAAAIRQTGLKNYVGTRCPGTGWHCIAPTHTPVVQIAPAGGVNVFTCPPGTRGPGSCFVLQINAGASAAGSAPRTSPGAAPAGDLLAGTNEFNCNEASSANPAILDAGTCGSLTQANTTGANLATSYHRPDDHAAISRGRVPERHGDGRIAAHPVQPDEHERQQPDHHHADVVPELE